MPLTNATPIIFVLLPFQGLSGKIYYEVNRAQSGGASVYFDVHPLNGIVVINTPLYKNRATDETYSVSFAFQHILCIIGFSSIFIVLIYKYFLKNYSFI